jgi:hypothetical protein
MEAFGSEVRIFSTRVCFIGQFLPLSRDYSELLHALSINALKIGKRGGPDAS